MGEIISEHSGYVDVRQDGRFASYGSKLVAAFDSFESDVVVLTEEHDGRDYQGSASRYIEWARIKVTQADRDKIAAGTFLGFDLGESPHRNTYAPLVFALVGSDREFGSCLKPR